MSNRLPPGPRGSFLLGVLPGFINDTLPLLLDFYQYGPVASARFGPFRVYSANSPDAIHEVLVTQADKFYKANVTKWALEPTLGKGLFLSEGDFWKRQRRLVQPSFHSRRIGAYADIIVNYAQDLISKWQSGAALDVDREMVALTMNIITKTLFDVDVSEEARRISDVITVILRVTDQRLNALFPYPYWLPTNNSRNLKKAVAKLDQIIQGFIDQRRATGADKGDLLSMLLEAQDEDGSQMTDKQVRDEAITLFGAGHETTATALTWIWYLLSQNPDVEAKLHAEVDGVLDEQTPKLEDLAHLPYTEMVVKEAMRLYPPAFATTRQTMDDVTLLGYTIPKDSVVLLNFYAVHRDARYFPAPEKFVPERFSPENEKNIPKYAYLPFGAGPRVCVGNLFAMMEARLVLATIAQRWRLALAPGQQVVPQRMFTLKPKYGMSMIPSVREAVLVAAGD
jgi:cytochrome P450